MTERTHPPDAAVRPRPRLHHIDNLRILLTVLVVLHHVAVTYGNIPVWYYTEPAQDPTGVLLDLLVITNQAFFMGFFFLISGYFVPGSHERRGSRAFLRERLRRLGVPLLLFILLLRPLLTAGHYPQLRADFAEQGVELPYWLYYLLTWDPGPLWFVEVLLVLTLGYLLLHRLRGTRAAVPSPRRPPAPGRLPGPLAVAAFVVGLTLATHGWRVLAPAPYWPFVGLPSPGYLPQYVALFTVGVLAFRHDWFRRIPRAAGWAGFAVAAAALAVFLTVRPLLGEAAGHPGTWSALAVAAWENTFAVGMVLGLLVLFRERFGRQGRPARFLSDHAFAVYVLHPLVLVGLGHAFSGWEAPAVAKFAVVAVLAIPLCWLLAALVRTLPYAERVL
ncbi:MAG TPA: acyltransferase family protein [Thermobifida alba]|nr:acyltransferase family protein [Thermobifida alba]